MRLFVNPSTADAVPLPLGKGGSHIHKSKVIRMKEKRVVDLKKIILKNYWFLAFLSIFFVYMIYLPIWQLFFKDSRLLDLVFCDSSPFFTITFLLASLIFELLKRLNITELGAILEIYWPFILFYAMWTTEIITAVFAVRGNKICRFIAIALLLLDAFYSIFVHPWAALLEVILIILLALSIKRAKYLKE